MKKAFLILALVISVSHSQVMKIHLSNGQTESISISQIQKITFDLITATKDVSPEGLKKIKIALAVTV